MTKFALFEYNTQNIGDEIQSLAALKFLPKVDYFINRDYINYFVPDTDEEIKLIMNGWYSHQPHHFPIKQSQIHPLLISMYIVDHVKPIFSSSENIEFFKKYQPVGGRSKDTSDFLTSLGVDSYFSGCLTLTLQKEESVKKRDYILAVDVPDQVYHKIKSQTDRPVIRLHPYVNHQFMSTSRKMKLAQYFLYLYQSAHSVITTRLHATLPCLALETNVLMLEEPGFDASRFDSLRELANHMTIQEFLETEYNVNNPLQNPTTYLTLREDLENRCQEFTGFKSQHGYLNGQTVEEFLHDPELLQNIATGLHAGFSQFGV
ncbi:TPA: polysaccharide pyruvyl transferase family protein [Streptococcus suis]|nr:polysaccharide pyruvyl transferase family protein [Streptococcus suis]